MIKYQSDLNNITADKLSCFCVGWQQPLSGENLKLILENSYRFILAVDAGNDTVVGFVNSLSDGVCFAFIPMLEVLPAYKNMGIGTAMLNRLFAELDTISCIDLTCDTDLQAYYERFGMLKSHGMVFRKFLSAEQIDRSRRQGD